MLIKNYKALPNKMGKRNRLDYRASIMTERFLSMMLKVCANPDLQKRAVLINLKSFIDQVPLDLYSKDSTVYALIVAITCVLKNKLDGATEIEDLVDFVNIDLTDNYNEIKDSIIFPTILSAEEATEKETNLVIKTTDTYIRYEAILANKDNLTDILTDIGSGNISSLDNALEELKEIITLLHTEFEKTEGNNEGISIIHTTDPQAMREALEDSYDEMRSPKTVLKLGLKAFNLMISPQGGFRDGTANYIYADTNTFKSALLRYIDKWITIYNSDQFKEDFLKTGKRPTILFISLEDGPIEDFSRYFITYTKEDILEPADFDEAISTWRKNYNSIIDTTHINSSDKPINLEFVDSTIKRLDEDNYKVIAVIIDSFDLMAPSTDDIYRHITDETTIMSNRAKAIQKWIADKPFPLITAHQLNRAGNQYIMEKKDSGCVDLAKTLGRSFISGAYDIERRAYFSCFIYTEYSKFDNELYLECFRSKSRGKRNEQYEYFVTKLRNGFLIDDDYGKETWSTRFSIMPDDLSFSQGAKDIGQRGISSISNMDSKDRGKIIEAKKETEKEPVCVSSSVSSTGEVNNDNRFDMFAAINIVEYCRVVAFMNAGYAPFDVSNPDLTNHLKIGEDGTKYFYSSDDQSVTPFNCK